MTQEKTQKAKEQLKEAEELLSQYDTVLTALEDTDIDVKPIRKKVNKLKRTASVLKTTLNRLP